MAGNNYLRYNGGSTPGSTGATPNTVCERDSSGGLTVADITAVLAILGGLQAGIAAKTTTYTALTTDFIIKGDATGGAFTINLPLAASCAGQILAVMKTDSGGNAVTLDGNGTETINGSTTLAISSQYSCKIIVCDGTGWYVISAS